MNEQKSNSGTGPDPATQSELPSSDNSAPPTSKLDPSPSKASDAQKAREIGGQKGPEPTRYGDWEKNGRCTDF